MSPSQPARPGLKMIAPDLAAFALGLGCAWMLGWNTTDLVWSLWLSSLVLGYLSILSPIARAVLFGSVVIFSDGFPAPSRVPAVLIGLAIAVFVLMFFSIHFCGFHAVHARFLSAFFPISGVPRQAFGAAFLNPILLWKDAFHYLVPKYGVFLLPVVIAERRALFGSIGWLMRARQQFDPARDLGQLLKDSGVSAHGLFSRPYLNIVRMHGLIFFFAICHALKFDGFPVYFVVYSVYFFPWSAFGKTAADPQATAVRTTG
jgi:hypothetical protein